MPEVLLHKVDEEFPPVNYDIGEHVLGRGDKLGCDSRKVSRKHGLLKITSDDISLTSTNNNPCFHQNSNVTKISLITFGNTVQIQNGDKIALSLTHGWFRVEIKKEDNETASCSGKKRSTEIDEESCSKKQKITDEENERESENSTSILNITTSQENATLEISSIENEAAEEEQDIKVEIKQEILSQETNIETKISETPSTSVSENVEVKLEPPDNIKEEVDKDAVSEEASEQGSSKKDVKTEPNDNETEENDSETQAINNDASTSNSTFDRVWRDRCWYGDSCYRRNPAHKAEFSHPNDSDYESDSQDPRPVCCYGIGCYRKNREHRKRYRHPGQRRLGTKPPGKGRMRKAKIKAQQKKTPQYSDSEDDSYDLEHPFINDASSDEYEPSTSSETESDYDESESQEDTARLLKEAKKFTRK